MQPTAAPTFKIVDKHVARNPVARAIARKALRDATLDFQIELYELPAGAKVQASAIAASKTFAVALGVLLDTQRGDGPDFKVIAGGMSCLAQCAQRGYTWRPADAPAVDQALKRSVAVYAAATAQQTERAWLRVTQLEREAGLIAPAHP